MRQADVVPLGIVEGGRIRAGDVGSLELPRLVKVLDKAGTVRLPAIAGRSARARLSAIGGNASRACARGAAASSATARGSTPSSIPARATLRIAARG